MDALGEVSDGSDVELDGDDIDVDFLEDNGQFNDIYGDNDRWRLFFDDSDDEEFEGFDGEWKTENFTPRVRRPYTGHGGATIQHPEEAQPVHYFELLWGDDLWNRMVVETNRYADQERERNPPPPYAPRWKPVDIPTMKAFLGLTFVMGIMRLPSRNDYWRNTKRMFATSFGQVMPRDRFNLIWRYLHFQDNEMPAANPPDKLRKVRPVIEHLNGTFNDHYTSYGDVTVDESMVKFKGRLSFRQYLPAKPVKWGMKLWTLCESTTGYLHRFQVYTGRENNAPDHGLSQRVVTELMGNLQFTNVRVFFDNFYTGTELLTDLLASGIYACGTVRSNRKGLPVHLLPKNLRLDKHSYQLAQKDDLTFSAWMDTKPVLMLSNFHDPDAVGSVNRRSGNPEQRQVRVPKMVDDYQQNMKGVDLCDQMLGYYVLNHRSRKWWRRLFHHLQMATAYNAYVIAKDSNPEKVRSEWPNFQDFLEDLAEGLIGGQTAPRAVPLQPVPLPGNRHAINPTLFDKKKNCLECRAKAAVGERVTATRQGCEPCRTPVCKKCVADHLQRVNRA